MDMDYYETEAEQTAEYPGQGEMLGLYYTALGLAGEGGEVADKVSKIIRDDGCELTDERRQQLIREGGDVLWFLSQFAGELGVTLEHMARVNLDKLAARDRADRIHGDGDER